MKSNYPYRATAMKACDPMWGKTGPEYGANADMGTATKPPKRPSAASASASMHDGPYGGKKPQS